MSLIVEEQNEIKAFKAYSHLCLNYHLFEYSSPRLWRREFLANP